MNQLNPTEEELLNPTEEEFRAARNDAEYDSEHAEDAYQVCRCFRGQMFLRDRAERWLKVYRTEHATR